MSNAEKNHPSTDEQRWDNESPAGGRDETGARHAETGREDPSKHGVGGPDPDPKSPYPDSPAKRELEKQNRDVGGGPSGSERQARETGQIP